MLKAKHFQGQKEHTGPQGVAKAPLPKQSPQAPPHITTNHHIGKLEDDQYPNQDYTMDSGRLKQGDDPHENKFIANSQEVSTLSPLQQS